MSSLQRAPRSYFTIASLATHTSTALVAGFVAFVATGSNAQTWRLVPAIAVEETATSNVNLAPSDRRQSDLVTQITPSLRVSEKGARTNLDGVVSVPLVLYARTGNENNTAYLSANIRGNVALVDRFLYVEGAISTAQTFFSPFGAQPASLVNATQNRYTTDSFRVSPYIRGSTDGYIAYELRNNNVWTNLSGAPIATRNSYYNQWIGTASNTEARLGWRADVDFTETRFNEQKPIRTALARVKPIYNVDPQVRLSASGGYESNEYLLTSSRGAIYGLGFAWRPTDRTNVVGNWEHRFFGSSYLFSFEHRTPLSVWSINTSRNITTYPQQVASLPAGVDVPSLVNTLFLSRIPDPTERQRAVDQFMQERGLPSVLASPLNLYSQQIQLQQSLTASIGLFGARNNILVTVFNVRTEPIAAAGAALPPLLAGGDDSTQMGASLFWTHRLTASARLTTSVAASRAVANGPSDAKTNQGVARMVVSSPLSATTNVFAGARFQVARSNNAFAYNEVAAFVGLSHDFR